MKANGRNLKYRIVLIVLAVFGAISAAGFLGACGVSQDNERQEEPPVVNGLTEPEPAEAEGDASETEESEIMPEPKDPPVPENTPEPTPETADVQKICDAYLALLSESRGDMPGYYIYDIDKDGIPELLLTAEDGPDRGLEVWSYLDGAAYSAGILWGFSNGMPIPASYPNGNGIVLTEVARDYECIWVISKEGTAMSGDVRNASNSVYEEPLYNTESVYYRNAEEGMGVSVGHPYRTETIAPFFEGSQLLGFNSTEDSAALKEALGL